MKLEINITVDTPEGYTRDDILALIDGDIISDSDEVKIVEVSLADSEDITELVG